MFYSIYPPILMTLKILIDLIASIILMALLDLMDLIELIALINLTSSDYNSWHGIAFLAAVSTCT